MISKNSFLERKTALGMLVGTKRQRPEACPISKPYRHVQAESLFFFVHALNKVYLCQL